MRAFLERHLRAYQLTALFDAPRLEESIRNTLVVLLAVAPPTVSLFTLVIWLFDRSLNLLPIVVLGVLFGAVAAGQLYRGRPNPTPLYELLAALIALGAWFGDVGPIAGIVAGAAVASTASFTLIEGRRSGLRPLLLTTFFLSLALFAGAPGGGTLIGIAVLVVGQAAVWWLIGTVADEVRLMSARFRALVDGSNSGIVIVGRSGVIDFINKAGRKLVGDVQGEHASVLIDVPALGNEEAAAQVRTVDGEAVPVVARRSEFQVGNSSFEMVVFVDQRGRLKERTRLEESEAQYRALFDRVPVGLYTSTVEGEIIHSNEALVAMFGFDSQAELLAVSASDLYVDGALRTRLLDDLAADGALTAEYRLRRKDGTVIWVRDHCSVQVGTDGRPDRYHGELTDITAERRANDELRKTLEEREQLVAAVSHELRTPLTSVLGLAQLLVDEELAPAEVSEAHRILLDQSLELSFIVEDLLVASQLSHGGLRVSPRSVDLASVVDDAVDMIGLGGRELDVTVPEQAQAMGDPTRVRQVVRNLLSNAAKYGGPRVRVEVEQMGPVVAITVADNGGGLGEQADEAFEAYRRLRPDSTDHGSLGLGLTLSKGLAEAMNGSLTYVHDGGWARFTLTLDSVGSARPDELDQRPGASSVSR